MNPTEHLSYAERIARIGELLAKGITLMLLDDAEKKRRGLAAGASSDGGVNGAQKESAPVVKIGDDVERSIYEYLSRVHSASPRDIQRGLDLSKATTFRKLANLTAANLVVRSGKTTAIKYRLAPAAPAQPQPTVAEPAPNPEPEPVVT